MLLADDDPGKCMIPNLMYHQEHGDDPVVRIKPIGAEQREKVIESMMAGLVAPYRYFRQHGKLNAGTRGPNPPHANNKTGPRTHVCTVLEK
jgi:hypothetical protein